MNTKTLLGWATLTCSLSLAVLACGQNRQPTLQRQNQHQLNQDPPIGYIEHGTNTLHLLNSQGQPLPGFTPIPGVMTYTIFSRLIGYKLTQGDEFHVLDFNGQPLGGFTAVTGVGEFLISDQFIAYKLQNNELHVLNTQGQPVLLASAPFAANVNNFKISNRFIGYISNLDELHILNSQGQPIQLEGNAIVTGVDNWDISDQLIGYRRSVPPYTLRVTNDQGQEIVNPIDNVFNFKLSNRLFAHTSVHDNNLYIYNAQGQHLITAPNVGAAIGTYQLSNELIAYIDNTPARNLHLLNDSGQALPGFTPVSGVERFKLSFRFLGYQLDTAQNHTLHLLLLNNGQPVGGFSPADNVIELLLHSTQ